MIMFTKGDAPFWSNAHFHPCVIITSRTINMFVYSRLQSGLSLSHPLVRFNDVKPLHHSFHFVIHSITPVQRLFSSFFLSLSIFFSAYFKSNLHHCNESAQPATQRWYDDDDDERNMTPDLIRWNHIHSSFFVLFIVEHHELNACSSHFEQAIFSPRLSHRRRTSTLWLMDEYIKSCHRRWLPSIRFIFIV